MHRMTTMVAGWMAGDEDDDTSSVGSNNADALFFDALPNYGEGRREMDKIEGGEIPVTDLNQQSTDGADGTDADFACGTESSSMPEMPPQQLPRSVDLCRASGNMFCDDDGDLINTDKEIIGDDTTFRRHSDEPLHSSQASVTPFAERQLLRRLSMSRLQVGGSAAAGNLAVLATNRGLRRGSLRVPPQGTDNTDKGRGSLPSQGADHSTRRGPLPSALGLRRSVSRRASNESQASYTQEYQSFKRRTSCFSSAAAASSMQSLSSALIADAIWRNFLFLTLNDDKIDLIIAAFKRYEYSPNSAIINQGEYADDKMHFYIITEGSCQVIVNGNRLPEPYGTLPTGASFGELSLLFGSPRAATITASEDGPAVAYRLDARVFKRIIGETEIEELKKSVRRIDDVIDQVAGITKKTDGNIIRGYQPDSGWIRKQWRGTILYYTWRPVLSMVVLTVAVAVALYFLVGPEEFNYEAGGVPNPDHPSVVHLHLLGDIFGYLTALVTFILAFFLNEAFAFWKKMYWTARSIQGRLQDISICMAGAAKRDGEGRLTAVSKKVMDEVAQLQRLAHILFWAKEKKAYGILLSPRGLSRMQSRGLMTNEQYDSMLEIGFRGSGVWQACLTWMTTSFTAAATEGHIKESTYLLVLLENTTKLRGLMVDVDDMYAGRCPIVYIHFVQLLVDCYIIIAPFALVVTSGYWAILSVAILTLFYAGLLEVAKMLLDPLDNDRRAKNYDETPNFDFGVLIRESNDNSVRYQTAADFQPKGVNASIKESTENHKPGNCWE